MESQTEGVVTEWTRDNKVINSYNSMFENNIKKIESFKLV